MPELVPSAPRQSWNFHRPTVETVKTPRARAFSRPFAELSGGPLRKRSDAKGFSAGTLLTREQFFGNARREQNVFS
jgi:hypothetical protein